MPISKEKKKLDECSRKCDNQKQFGKISTAVKLSQDYCENQCCRSWVQSVTALLDIMYVLAFATVFLVHESWAYK